MSTTVEPSSAPERTPTTARSSEDYLPPVTPPTGRFIVQLFVIPAVIVTVIVLLWLLLAGVVLRQAGDPEELIKGLYGTSEKRWQNAQQLADMLRDNRHASFKRNRAAANQLAQLIERELRRAESGETLSEGDVTLLMFAARALGEFHVADGLPALLDAASFDRGSAAIDVRRAAIQAIAVLISHMKEQSASWPDQAEGLAETLLKLADSDQRLVRSDTAFALGVLGTPPAIDKLAEMASDPYPDARYNAATALARHGDLRAMGTLSEMLDPREGAGLRYEDERRTFRVNKRATILINAFRATERLATEHPKADFSPLIEPLKELIEADRQTLQDAYIEPLLVGEAERILAFLTRQ